MQSDMLYLFCWQLVWWAIILVFSSASFILFWYIFISVSVFKIIFTKAFNFLPRNEMNKNQLILYVTEIYLCTIYTKQNLIFRDLVQFQGCRWFHVPSNTDCISYELNKIFYFQKISCMASFSSYDMCVSISLYFKVICCTQVHSLLFYVLFILLSRMKRSLNRYMYCFCWKMFCVPWTQISKVYCIEKFSVHDSCINKAKNITK